MSNARLSPEELINCLTHLLGLVLSVIGVTLLVVLAGRFGTAWHVVSCAVYGASLVVVYGASTLYHATRRPRLRRLLRVLDHVCIYLLIAGTYTPFTLVALGGGWGWTLFGLVWGFALLGVFFKIFHTGKFEVISTVAYVLCGWLALVAIKPMLERFPTGCLVWLLVGGVLYTVGVRFYLRDRLPYRHAAWHLFVLGGSACHYVAVVLYVVPTGLAA